MKHILLDGACGTCLFEKARARGLEEKPVWIYSLEAPDMVRELAEEYISAGTQIIQTNTFDSNPATVERAGFDLNEVIAAGVRIAREAADACTDRKVWVSLDIGPLSKHLEPYGDMSEEECRKIYRRIIECGASKADLITLETFMDINMLRIAAEEAEKTGLPFICSMTFQKGPIPKTLFGNSVEELAEFANEFAQGNGLIAVGMNCSFGPEGGAEIIKRLSQLTSVPLMFKPNADGLSAEDFSAACKEVLPLVTYIGACCGSNPHYIKALL